jgi:hypothetical protein
MYYKSIALSSYESRSSYPENLPTQFTNILAETLCSSDRQKPLFVKLRAISLSTDVYSEEEHSGFMNFFIPLWQYPGYVEVTLQEATAQIDSGEYVKYLGGFAFPPEDFQTPIHAQKRQANYGRHVFKDSPWVKLNATSITQFTIALNSVTGFPLILVNPLYKDSEEQVDATPPTIVELDVTDDEAMASGEGAMTIGCSSWHPELYPTNTHAEFRSPLPHHMSFPNYQVALARIVFPANLRQSMKMTFWIEGEPFTFDALHDFEYRESSMPRVINAAIQGSRFAGHITFKMDRRTTGRMQARFGRGRLRAMRNQTIRIVLDKAFQQCFHLEWEWGEGVHYMPPGGPAELAGSREPRFTFVTLNPTALLECEQVEHSLVGQEQYRLLQYVPVLATETPLTRTGRSVTDWNEGGWESVRELVYEPPELHWVDFTNKPLSNIKFTFREPSNGQVKSFDAGTGPDQAMIITLRLRPKPLPTNDNA